MKSDLQAAVLAELLRRQRASVLRTTRECPVVTTALAASIQADLATTRELPAVPEVRPASQWSTSALDRLLADLEVRT